MRKKPILIIGAGISGLAAAHYLTALQYPVILLEARDRIGGRIHDIKITGGMAALGAAYLHGEGTAEQPNPCALMLKALNKIFVPINRRDVTLVVGSQKITDPARLAAIKHYLDQCFKISQDFDLMLEEKTQHITSMETLPSLKDKYDAISRQFENPDLEAQIALNWIRSNETGSCAVSLDRVTQLEDLFHCHPFSGADHILVEAGYSALINKLYQESSKTGLLELRLNSEVTKLIYNNSNRGCEYLTQAGNTLKLNGFQAIICTLPIGVLQSGRVQFEPALPKVLQSAIHHMEKGDTKKIVLEFENAFWEDTQFIFCVEEKPSDVRYLYINLHHFTKGKTATLVAFFKNDPDCAIESESLLIESSVNRLKKIFPEANMQLRKATFVDWAKDKYSEGAWCILGAEMTLEEINLLKNCPSNPLGKGLFLAGEHTAETSTVDCSYLSGLKAAESLHALQCQTPS